MSSQACLDPPALSHAAPLAGEPFRLRLSVRCLAGGGRRTVSVSAGPRSAGSEDLVLLPGRTSQIEFPMLADTPGVLTIEARLGGKDDWEGDDAQRIAVAVRSPPRVLLVRSAADVPQDRAIEAALAPFFGSALSRLKLRSATPPEIAESALAGIECIAVSGAAQLGAREWGLLRRRVEMGAGLLAFLGPGTAPSAATTGLLPPGIGDTVPLGAGTGLSFLDPAHPVLGPFADGRNGDLASVEFSRARRLDPPRGARAGAGLRSLAAFTSGPPAIVEAAVGRGKVLAAAFQPDPAETTLPREPAFVVFLHAAVTYLADIRPSLPPARCGRGASVRVEPVAFPRRWVLSAISEPGDPRRWETASEPRPGFAEIGIAEIPAGSAEAYLPPLPASGIYRLDEEPAPDNGSEDACATPLCVHLPEAESDLASDPKGVWMPLFRASSAGVALDGALPLADHLVTLRPGRPLAGTLAIVLMALLLAEAAWCLLRPRAA